jgi:four helix bundle protein
LVLGIDARTSGFPRSETYGLAARMRTAGVSVAANIVEGFRRSGRPDKRRLLNVAQGSLEELRYYLISTQDLGYSSTGDLMLLLEEVSRLLDSYRRSILTSYS